MNRPDQLFLSASAPEFPTQHFSTPTFSTSRRLSRDEMNLAEFPLSVLSTRSNPKIKTLEFSDSVKLKNGELIDRKWIITGADKFGLPTATDDEVLLGLLKLTVDRGMNDSKVYFTRYEILKTLRWSTEGRSYSRLQKALDRLSGVRIKATNAFYDNSNKLHSTKNFGLLDAYEINDGHEGKKSFFRWSEVLFKSFQVGFIKKLDLDFYLALKSSVSKRIYRFLDKHFWYKSRVQMNLITFAHEKIGVSRNYRFVSSIRQQIDPAIEELINLGFLGNCEYIGKGATTEIALFSGKEKNQLQSLASRPEEKPPRVEVKLDLEQASLGQANILENKLNDDNCNFLSKVTEALISRGLKSFQVERFVTGRAEETLSRMLEIIEYFDYLVSSGSNLVSRSPVGFLYRAIEKVHEFTLPKEMVRTESKQTKFSFVKQPKLGPNLQSAESSGLRLKSEKAACGDRTVNREAEYLIERKNKIKELRINVESGVLLGIQNEVKLALSKLKSLISPARFLEAVEHGVDERLAKLFALPSFDEWLTSRCG